MKRGWIRIGHGLLVVARHVRRRMNSTAFTVAWMVLLVVAATAPAGLTYSGFCTSLFRYISDDEKIGIAVNALLNWRRRTAGESAGGGPSSRAKIAYQGVADFLARNAHCCSVGYYGGDMPAPTFRTRLVGIYANTVKIRYAERHVIDPTFRQVLVGLDVCGSVRGIAQD
jgi:hypothetical protein